MIAKIINAFKLLKCSSLPLKARAQLLYLALKRRIIPSEEFNCSLGLCEIFLSGKDTRTDMSTLWGIFVEELYATNYRGALVFDVGAHKGYYGAYTLLKGASWVYSFEPESTNFEFLSRAAQSFHPSGNQGDAQWVVEKSAIGSHNSTVALYITDRSWSHSIFVHKEARILRKEMVPVKAFASVLSGVVRDWGVRVIVKINAEGAACDIVLGTGVEYWRAVNEVFVTVEPFSPCRKEEVVSYLQGSGFQLIAEQCDILHLKKKV